MFTVTVKWAKGKTTHYIVPSESRTPIEAAFNVALLWHGDFKTDHNNRLTSVEVTQDGKSE